MPPAAHDAPALEALAALARVLVGMTDRHVLHVVRTTLEREGMLAVERHDNRAAAAYYRAARALELARLERDGNVASLRSASPVPVRPLPMRDRAAEPHDE